LRPPPNDDPFFEGTESVYLTLNSGTGYGLGPHYSACVSIADNEVDPQITLDENALFAWEDDRLRGFIGAHSGSGTISSFQIDINNNNVFDAYVSYDSSVSGGLLQDGPSVGLDNGTYPATLRVTLASGVSEDLAITFPVGNVPPGIDIPDLVEPNGLSVDLPVGIIDPGPDTVSVITIDWGDGTTNTYHVPSGVFSHTYAADGIYGAIITATDEDCTVSRNYQVLAGDTDAPDIADDITIESANATITNTDEAVLNVVAKDIQGNTITNIVWDLDEDGTFDTSPQTVVTLYRVPGDAAFHATVRITAANDAVKDLEFYFVWAGPANVAYTAGNYRTEFVKVTPDMPADWGVHHTLQQQPTLAGRYMAERGVNVHDPKYLRGVPQAYHKEISVLQQKWWAKQSKAFGGDMEATYRNVALADVDTFNAKVDAMFKDKWIKAGKNQSKAVTAIVNRMKVSAR
jgi:hypothetical protein